MITWLAACAACMWVGLLLLPWRPWSTRERLVIDPGAAPALSTISVLIPARDEAPCIRETLARLNQQGQFSRIVVIDDQSSDGTGEIARSAG
ncbi:MAG: glycosyltransferase family 2 protein, partial [Gammaproteobacteria bacterium]